MDEIKNDNIEFRFIAIELRSKTLKPLSSTKNNASVTFTVRASATVQHEQGLVIMNVYVTIFDGNDNEVFAEFSVDCIFDVVEFDKHIKINDQGLFVIPTHLDAIIKPVSISTTRGILYSELRGTYLGKSIMPVIFIDTMKEEPVTN